MNSEIALAFLDSCLKNPKVQGHLEGHLGWNQVAEAKDFQTNDMDRVERAERLTEYLSEVVKCLENHLATQPRQAELPLDQPESAEAS